MLGICGVEPHGELTARVIGPWEDANLIYGFGQPSRQINSEIAKRAVRAAFATWANSSSQISFTQATPWMTDKRKLHILVEFREAADPDIDMRGGTIAHADFPPNFGFSSRLPLPLHFDDTEHKWCIGAQESAFDLESVALHEAGHLLGLMHSTVRGSIMWPSVKTNFVNRTLHRDDLMAIHSLYGE